jgi:hypothetical protein
VLAVAVLVAAVAAVRRPRLRGALERPAGWMLRQGSRMLGLALIATGLGASQALAAVLLYRLASFWLVALAGWLVVFRLRPPRRRQACRAHHPGTGHRHGH